MRKPRTRIEDLRRLELIEAAHRVFMLHGLSGMTTARICAEAGMSPGILSYYFKGKDDVLFAMVRYNNRVLAEDVTARLRAARTPRQRLMAVVEGNFPPDAFQPNVAAAWLSVCAASATNPRYARLQRIFYRRLMSNLASVFRGVLGPDRFASLALATGTMIDGLWLRKSTGDPLAHGVAVALLITTIEALLTPAERVALG